MTERVASRSFTATEKDWREVTEAAVRAGLPRSVWIRLALLRAARKPRK